MEPIFQVVSAFSTPIIVFAGLIGAAYTVRNQIQNIIERLKSFEIEIIELRKIVVSLARQEERMTAMDHRLLSQGQRIDAQGERITSMDQRVMTNTFKIDEILSRERKSN